MAYSLDHVIGATFDRIVKILPQYSKSMLEEFQDKVRTERKLAIHERRNKAAIVLSEMLKEIDKEIASR